MPSQHNMLILPGCLAIHAASKLMVKAKRKVLAKEQPEAGAARNGRVAALSEWL